MYVFVFLTLGTQQTTTDPIVPTRPPTRRACAAHPCAQYCRGSLCLSEPTTACISPPAFTGYQIFSNFYTGCHCLSPCWFFCVLLCVIQQCHCSSCALHSALTAEVGANSRGRQPTVCMPQMRATLSVLQHSHLSLSSGLAYAHTCCLLLGMTGFLLSVTDHPLIVCIRRVLDNQSVVFTGIVYSSIRTNTYSSNLLLWVLQG